MNTPLELEVFAHHKELEIINSNGNTPVYAGRLQRSKPQVLVSRVADQAIGAQAIGQASFHKLSSDIDVQLNGQLANMHRKGGFSTAHEVSVAGLNWSWAKDGFMTNDLKLEDNNSGRIIARFQRAKWSRKKLGTIQILGTHPPHILDAIVITGLAKMELVRRRQRSGTAAAAGASAGC